MAALSLNRKTLLVFCLLPSPPPPFLNVDWDFSEHIISNGSQFSKKKEPTNQLLISSVSLSVCYITYIDRSLIFHELGHKEEGNTVVI